MILYELTEIEDPVTEDLSSSQLESLDEYPNL